MQLCHFEAAQVTVGDRWGKRRAREPSSTRLYWQVRGHALLEVGGRRVQLESGDLALLPRADAHVLRDRLDSVASSSSCPGMHRVDEHVYEAYPAGRSQLVVAVAEHATPCGWLELLPDLVMLRSHGKPRWVRDTLAARASVSALPQASRAEVAQSLLRVLFEHAFEVGAIALDPSRVLGRTDMPVKQVAARVGYANDAAFARAFGRAMGESPARFRVRISTSKEQRPWRT
ncbi:cupin domain-containing protein [Pendulispora rubella]|uniref:Cupin domain-containing protein n=1 Tax=Pendulispora rubella TaxID=2741070 RepID=A0ABZ2LCI0_9BACT